jgi:hypothetical protein
MNANDAIWFTVADIIRNNWVDDDDVPKSVRDLIKWRLENGATAPLNKELRKTLNDVSRAICFSNSTEVHMPILSHVRPQKHP